MLKSFFKIFTIFPRHELRHCVFIIVCMVFGAVLEALGIGAILPLISVMGQPDFLEKTPIAAQCASFLHIETHTEFIIFLALGLILLYVLKNAYLAWQINLRRVFRCASKYTILVSLWQRICISHMYTIWIITRRHCCGMSILWGHRYSQIF